MKRLPDCYFNEKILLPVSRARLPIAGILRYTGMSKKGGCMQTVRKIVDADALASLVDLPRSFNHRRVEITVREVDGDGGAAEKRADSKDGRLPLVSREELDEMIKGSKAEKLAGFLNKGDWSWLPPPLTPENITAKDIRELRLKEKYGI
jgi:hypothetical protein